MQAFHDEHNPLLNGLNGPQWQAVTLGTDHALVLAGAGSGKTRVLTTRMAWLIQQGHASAAELLAVTFTNKAAKEMLTRLEGMLPVSVRGMWVGTFHGLCNRLLRAHWKLAQLPQAFQILDSQDQLSAIKRLMKQHHIDEDRLPPKQVQWFIAGAKEDGLRPAAVTVNDEDGRKKLALYELYEQQCQKEGVVDFGELMLRSYELLRDNPLLREHYQRRFKFVLIDEFQDTNRLQYAWIKQLVGREGGTMMAVGDDDQSIYAFRGARVGNMRDFVTDFDVKVQIKLEENYRSVGHILAAANQLIDHNKGRLGKNLRTTQGEGERLRVMESPTDYAEAQWVVEEMQQLHKQDGVALHEMAVLYRSNAQSRAIENALFTAGVPYRVYGGLRFFERAEIKHALAYLRLLDNPHDDTSFLRVVNFPPRGIGARSIEQLQDQAQRIGCSLHDAVSAVPGKAGANLGAFVAMLDVMREGTADATLRQIIELVLQRSGLVTHYQNEKDGSDRIENLDELVTAAERFVMQEGFGRDAKALHMDEPSAPVFEDTGETLSPLVAFLTHAALEAGDNQASAGQDAVQLMTVHAAKGLEFDAVFITGLEEGLFPHENSMNAMDGLEEERRLMYVAITRARKRLYLSHAQTRMLHGQTRYNIVSRFMDELPEESLKHLASKPKASQEAFAPRWGQGSAKPQPAWGNSGLTATTPGQWREPQAPAARANPQGITKGMRVFHAKFGEGQVLVVEGAGDDAKAQVSFSRHGTKWLALGIAKLTPIE